MTNIQNHLHLFTDVKDGLPDHGWHLIIDHNEKMKLRRLLKRGTWQNCSPTHYLDFSKLTTKVKAVQLAKESFVAGMEIEASLTLTGLRKYEMEDFIQEKQKEL